MKCFDTSIAFKCLYLYGMMSFCMVWCLFRIFLEVYSKWVLLGNNFIYYFVMVIKVKFNLKSKYTYNTHGPKSE